MEIVAINRSRHELFHYKAARCGSITQPLATKLLCALGGSPTCTSASAAADRRRGGGPRLTTIASRGFFAERPPPRIPGHRSLARFLERYEHYSRRFCERTREGARIRPTFELERSADAENYPFGDHDVNAIYNRRFNRAFAEKIACQFL